MKGAGSTLIYQAGAGTPVFLTGPNNWLRRDRKGNWQLMASVWTIAIGFIFLNSIFVAAEFATVASRSTVIRKAALSGNKLAKHLLPILETPRRLDEYIATCQIAITFSSLILGAYTETHFGPVWAAFLEEIFKIDHVLAESVAAVLILAVFTFLQILIGELLPKSVSLQHSEPIALFMYWPLRVASVILRPFIWLFNGSGVALLKLLGVPASSHKHVHSLEEIALLLAQSKDGGLLEPEEHERLHQALELSEKTAKQIMIARPNVAAISSQLSMEECYRRALTSPYTRLVVHGQDVDDVLGCVNVKQVIQAWFSRGEKATLRELITPAPIIPENLTLSRLITLLKAEHSHAAFVMDEHGSMVGLVTVGDILAELIEDINADEFKKPEAIDILEDGRIRLSGRYKLHRATKFLGELQDTEAETINGLIIEILERVPVEGDVVELKTATLTVEQVEHHAATIVTVKRRGASQNV
ncbi:MAG TPA: hemolysin family protein [Candidatus Melainabacteria bacterium]|nr:hemolysin family protein [Candidatus Melainabacteria bacterium]